MLFDSTITRKNIDTLQCSVCDKLIEPILSPLPDGSVGCGCYSATLKSKTYPLCVEHFKIWNTIIEEELKKFLKKDINAEFV